MVHAKYTCIGIYHMIYNIWYINIQRINIFILQIEKESKNVKILLYIKIPYLVWFDARVNARLRIHQSLTRSCRKQSSASYARRSPCCRKSQWRANTLERRSWKFNGVSVIRITGKRKGNRGCWSVYSRRRKTRDATGCNERRKTSKRSLAREGKKPLRILRTVNRLKGSALLDNPIKIVEFF